MPTRRTIPLLACLVLVATCISGRRADSSPGEPRILHGLVSYLPFNGDLAIDGAIGFKMVEAKDAPYEDGVWGKAILVKADGVRLQAWKLLQVQRGSMTFWVKPAWSGSDRSVPERTLMVSPNNFQITYEPAHGFFFMTGTTKEKMGFQWDYLATHAVDSWQPGEWHHVAISWDAPRGDKALYLDGNLVGKASTTWIDRGLGESYTLGSSNAPGVYDEWMIWNRVLSEAEIQRLARRDEVTRQELSMAPPSPQRPPRFPIVLQVKVMSHLDTVVAPGETFTARVPVRNTAAAPWDGTVRFTLRDFWEKPRATQEISVKLQPGEEKDLAVAFVAPENGAFKIAASARFGERLWEGDVAAFAAWPRPAEFPEKESFFGDHVNSWDEQYLAQAARLGQTWNRWLEGTFWSRVQPEPGEFKWLDADHVTNNRKYGLNILGLLIATPYWAVAKGPQPPLQTPDYPYYPDVPDMAKYRNYVYQTVSHYRKDIHYWEIGNEPDVYMEWTGTPEQFAQLAQAAYQEAKKADPTCTVLASGLSHQEWAWHDAAAKAGLFKYADVLSFHWYVDDGKSPEALYEEGKGIVEHFDRLVKAYGPGHPLPYWITEGGLIDTTWLRGLEYPGLPPEQYRDPLNWRQAALGVVQNMAIAQALGVKRYFYYFQNGLEGDEAYHSYSMQDVTNAPKPKLMAWVAMASQVDGLRLAGLVRRPEAHFWASVYEKPGNSGCVVLWWAGKQTTVAVSADWPGKLVKAVNIMGNASAVSSPMLVAEEPSYLHVAAPALAVISALQKAKLKVVAGPAVAGGRLR